MLEPQLKVKAALVLTVVLSKMGNTCGPKLHPYLVRMKKGKKGEAVLVTACNEVGARLCFYMCL